MKISVFFDIYCPYHENKDPGQIPLGLMDNGVDSAVITVTKKELENYNPKFALIQNERKEFYEDFWLKNDSDAIVTYHAQGKTNLPLMEKMKTGGRKVILKLDSDGKIAYPLKRHRHRVPLRERLTVANAVSDAYWCLAPKSLKRRKHAAFATEITKQIELCNATVIESPEALSNLNYFLTKWDRSDLIKKTHFIPNPVTPEFVEGEIGKKENIAVTHGRWDDYTVKNTFVMVETVVEFLTKRQDFRFIIFGSGIDRVVKLLEAAPQNIRDRVTMGGFMEHEKVQETLQSAKMLFVPSRWESFSIASAEALCTGCSIVGTPAEALRYFSMQGFSGSISATFDKKAIFAALLQDAIKWDNGEYNPEKTAAFWKPILNRKSVAKSIENLVRAS
jgi:glycosyltransferase involved in cell wall biosynthesis